jgi:hypothetical protein
MLQNYQAISKHFVLLVCELNRNFDVECPITAQRFKEFALPGATSRPASCFFSPAFVPVARQEWLSICQVACGWLSDRVSIMQGFKWL